MWNKRKKVELIQDQINVNENVGNISITINVHDPRL